MLSLIPCTTRKWSVCIHGNTLRGCPHLLLGNQCLGRVTKCCCVHTLSNRYVKSCVHSYSLSPCRTPFWNMSLATNTKQWTAEELTKTICTQGLGTHFFARVHWRSRKCPNSSVATWLKGVFTLVPMPSEYRTRVPCPSTKFERCVTCSGLLLQKVLCHSHKSKFIWCCLILRKGRNELTETWKIRAVLFPFDRSVIRYSHCPGPFSFPPDTWMVLNLMQSF